jgi:hypothetical protein
MRSRREGLLPNAFLDLPEVGALSDEGGAVDFVQGREPLAVMLPEVAKDRLVGVHAEELSDELDGDGLRVGKLGGRSALANTAALEPVVDEAEGGNDEGAKIHKRRLPLCRLVWSLPSVGRSFLWLKSSKKLAHEVS